MLEKVKQMNDILLLETFVRPQEPSCCEQMCKGIKNAIFSIDLVILILCIYMLINSVEVWPGIYIYLFFWGTLLFFIFSFSCFLSTGACLIQGRINKCYENR